ncbi:MAG TPA: YfhO family protein, partial [Pyrinomonadaceae bacterium]
EALRRIRGESDKEFEPRRTALLEVSKGELPSLPGGLVGSNATAQVSYQPNGMAVDTYADTAALLVFSEMNYPGWTATVDGVAQPIYATNFLLRSVPVQAGAHRVEMKYAAPSARTGAWISLATLLLLTSLALTGRRSRKAPRAIL